MYQGNFYKVLDRCSLWKDEHTEGSYKAVANGWIEKGQIVLYICPSFSRSYTHKVVVNDQIGWIKLDWLRFELVDSEE